MARFRLELLTAKLTYEPDIEVFTALSGRTPHLAAHYLTLAREDGVRGLSEVRANITFLNHIEEGDVAPAIRALCEALPWGGAPEATQAALDEVGPEHPAIARAAVDSLLVDVIATRDGRSHAQVLGAAAPAASHVTNQCLFWSRPEVYERLARRYLAEGFRKLKVRIGIADAQTDLERLAFLRALAGPDIEIAVDANGTWSLDEARARLSGMTTLGIAYVEQPTAIGDWDSLAAIGKALGVPVMLDEGLRTRADVERLIALGPPFLAHLKIVKFGGPRIVVEMARRLMAGGVDVMVGQMNEGGAATAMTVAAAIAARPRHAELYGAYGLVDDAVPVVGYGDCRARLARDRDLPAALDRARCTPSFPIGDWR